MRLGSPRYSFAVARYTADGALDTTFGGNGDGLQFISHIVQDRANAVDIQPDGKIVVAGDTGLADGDFMVARLNVDGTPDT